MYQHLPEEILCYIHLWIVHMNPRHIVGKRMWYQVKGELCLFCQHSSGDRDGSLHPLTVGDIQMSLPKMYKTSFRQYMYTLCICVVPLDRMGMCETPSYSSSPVSA